MQLSFSQLKRRRRLMLVLIAGAPLLISSGCASFQGEGRHLNPVETFPKVSVKKSAQINFTYIKKNNGREEPDYSSFKTLCRITCMDRIKESELFSTASWELKNPDIKIAIKLIKNTEHDIVQELLSPLTLFIYPVTETDTYDLLATSTDTKSGQQRIIKLHESMKTKSSIVMLPVMFFKFPAAEELKLTNKMYDNLCVEIYRTGILGTVNP